MRRFAIALLALSLSGCGIMDWFDSDDAHKPTPLVDIAAKVTVTPVWNAHVGDAGRYFFSPAQVGDDVVVADTDGDLVRLNSVTGAQVWKINVDDKLAAGVGADAGTIAVVTAKGDLVVFDVDGKQRWNYPRQNQPLVLRTAPGMVISAGMLYSGVPGGRLIAITDLNGGLRWDAAVTIPKGTTELERVADVMGKPILANREICVASFQGRAGCFDINTGGPIWTHEISTTTGIGVDGRGAYVSDESSVVQAFARSGGASLWKDDKLQYRKLTAPLAYNGSAVVGDVQGYLHWLSEDDGSIIGRIATDGSPINVSPILVSADGTQRLIAQTSKGGIYAFTTAQPE
jgi:outer membrane protein assembly factor BamB